MASLVLAGLAGLYGIFNFATEVASLVAWAQTRSFANDRCGPREELLSDRVGNEQFWIFADVPCGLMRWLPYSLIAGAAFLGILASILIILSVLLSRSTSPRGPASAVILQLAILALIFALGWGLPQFFEPKLWFRSDLFPCNVQGGRCFEEPGVVLPVDFDFDGRVAHPEPVKTAEQSGVDIDRSSPSVSSAPGLQTRAAPDIQNAWPLDFSTTLTLEKRDHTMLTGSTAGGQDSDEIPDYILSFSDADTKQASGPLDPAHVQMFENAIDSILDRPMHEPTPGASAAPWSHVASEGSLPKRSQPPQLQASDPYDAQPSAALVHFYAKEEPPSEDTEAVRRPVIENEDVTAAGQVASSQPEVDDMSNGDYVYYNEDKTARRSLERRETSGASNQKSQRPSLGRDSEVNRDLFTPQRGILRRQSVWGITGAFLYDVRRIGNAAARATIILAHITL